VATVSWKPSNKQKAFARVVVTVALGMSRSTTQTLVDPGIPN
jgi:hypothetical protein